MSHVIIFLSAVTDEFHDYREKLRAELQLRNATVRTQEDLKATGDDTLCKLDSYIEDCKAVIHIAGEMPGAKAKHLDGLRKRYPELAERFPVLATAVNTGDPTLSYTQWEAYLALYHDIKLIIATPTPEAPRYEKFVKDDGFQQAQKDHLARLRDLGRHSEITFANVDQLIARIATSVILDLLKEASPSLSERNISRLLDLLNRQDAVEMIVDEHQGEFRVVCGKEDGGINDLRQRLKDIELPWLSRRERRPDFDRMSKAEWRKYLLCDGEPIGWSPHHIDWPFADEDLGAFTVSEAHDEFIRRLLNQFREIKSTGPESLPALFEHLKTVRESHVISSDVPDRLRRARESAELISRLSQTFKGAPGDRFRVIIYVDQPSRPAFTGLFAGPSLTETLSGNSAVKRVALREVRRDQLLEWANLAENVVRMSANMVMEEVGAVYQEAGWKMLSFLGSQPSRSLPMKTLREGLIGRVRGWSAKN